MAVVVVAMCMGRSMGVRVASVVSVGVVVRMGV